MIRIFDLKKILNFAHFTYKNNENYLTLVLCACKRAQNNSPVRCCASFTRYRAPLALESLESLHHLRKKHGAKS